ncbi:hypothetical protein SA496_11000 [Pseudomonas sp. JS3066]|uniref:hypothetical protein n=1 Tax=unclassified Pseudomonas TaxID=196821 RepID=UPI000EA842EC|nr:MULTISPECIES: hypothetical protein [unclassified Pseudomonas]AYF86848.1 hypothetical protein D6Z43_06645 [Pseudomonas sp. DY-1]MDH4652259.1 hypothetical protein [Pseudomonas sp. BN606]MRK21834.1 hypothetical protein [Pseudomonas sp. JG-B]WVK95664.1 hypothetical protein SA496_11000 [Pseudomonas sp. JS3066]
MYSSLATPFEPRGFQSRIYAGDILRFSGQAAMEQLVALSRDLLEARLYPHRPEHIHLHLSHARQTQCFAQCQQEFIRSTEVQTLWRDLLEGLGFEVEHLACDRLHLRFQPHQQPGEVAPRSRTTATIAFHRDTWGSNLYGQTNWWAPIYPISAERTFAIYPRLWRQSLPNTSAEFDMQAILQRSHSNGRNSVDADEAIPHLLEQLPEEGAPVLLEPGELIAFSGAHAHAGVGNSSGLTRISFETRTLLIPDLEAGLGAPNVDGYAPWMTPGLFRRLSDGKRLDELLGCRFIEPYVAP